MNSNGGADGYRSWSRPDRDRSDAHRRDGPAPGTGLRTPIVSARRSRPDRGPDPLVDALPPGSAGIAWAWPRPPGRLYSLGVLVLHGLYTAYLLLLPGHRNALLTAAPWLINLLAMGLGPRLARPGLVRGFVSADIRLTFSLGVLGSGVLHLDAVRTSVGFWGWRYATLVDVALASCVVATALSSLAVAGLFPPCRSSYTRVTSTVAVVAVLAIGAAVALVPPPAGGYAFGLFLGSSFLGALAACFRPLGLGGLAFVRLLPDGGPLDPALCFHPEGAGGTVAESLVALPPGERFAYHQTVVRSPQRVSAHGRVEDAAWADLLCTASREFSSVAENLLGLAPFPAHAMPATPLGERLARTMHAWPSDPPSCAGSPDADLYRVCELLIDACDIVLQSTDHRRERGADAVRGVLQGRIERAYRETARHLERREPTADTSPEGRERTALIGILIGARAAATLWHPAACDLAPFARVREAIAVAYEAAWEQPAREVARELEEELRKAMRELAVAAMRRREPKWVALSFGIVAMHALVMLACFSSGRG